LRLGIVGHGCLDMGNPGREKRLNRITVLLDGRASDFQGTIKYRTDDTTS
jgi:hypothetical protein